MLSSTGRVPAHPGSGPAALGPRLRGTRPMKTVAVDTTDPAEFARALGSLYERSHVSALSGHACVKARLKHLDLRDERLDVRLAQLTISRATLRMPDHPYFTVCWSSRGSARSSVNGEAVVTEQGECIVASPGGPIDVEYLTDDVHSLIVRFGQAFMERELAAILGRPISKPLKFNLFPEISALGPFKDVLHLLRRDAEKPILTDHQLLAERLVRLAANSLLVCANHNYIDELRAPTRFTGPRPIQIALESLEADPLSFATVGDLAEVVSLSVRALEDGFKRHVGTTPLQYQRRVRLRRAHDDLLEANPYDTTATAIAFKWGYNNYGRFAAEYRRIYGRTPLEDLKGSH